MRVLIPDDVTALYEAFADAQGKPVEEVVTAQLRRFAKLEPGKRAIVIPAQLSEPIAAALGGLPLRDAEDLLHRVTAHAALTFEGIDLKLTIGQKRELEHRAAKQGKPVAALVQEIAEVLMRDLFYSVSGPSAKPAA